MTQTPKRQNKSKAELAQEMRMREMQEAQRKETARRRELASGTFYPLLLKHAKNIRHAQQICKIVDQAIMTLHNGQLATRTLDELNLAEQFANDTDEGAMAFTEIITAFKDEKLNACLEIIGGMSGAIDAFIVQETTTRPLSDLTTHFL